MITDILLTGYTEFITDEFLAAAFPNCRICITGEPAVKNSIKNRISVHKGELTAESCHKLFGMYEFDRVVCFSGGIEPFGSMKGTELELLTNILDARTPETRIVYVAAAEALLPENEEILSRCAEDICRRDAAFSEGVNIVRIPWIYGIRSGQKAFAKLFEEGEHKLRVPAGQEVSFLAAEDLAILIHRMFENWEYSLETYEAPFVFICTAERLTSLICLSSGMADISFAYSDGEARQLHEVNNVLRTRFLWFPVYSLPEDLPEMIAMEKATRRQTLSKRFEVFSKGRIIILILELLAGFAITELLLRLTGVATQFRMVDFRLLYVVIFASMYNMQMGLAAAALESVSLVFAYTGEGTSWVGLFYEPANWLPFIAYFTVGAVFGYIRNKDRELLQFTREDRESVLDRYNYLQQLNEDVLQEKKEYKNQIIGSRDSFGKIFDITQKLNESHPKTLMSSAVSVVESVMSNSTVAIYSCVGQRAYGRLVVSSARLNLPKSMPMDSYYEKLNTVSIGAPWVNRELDKDAPSYLFAVRNGETINAVIILEKAEFRQMTLYYENLFRVVCGLISNALEKAINYQEALQREKCVPGTENILLEKHFFRELAAEQEASEQKQAQHLLVHIDTEGLDLPELEKKLLKCVRFTDIIGCLGDELYVILLQASEAELPIISERFIKADVKYELISAEQQRLMLK